MENRNKYQKKLVHSKFLEELEEQQAQNTVKLCFID